MYKVTKRDCPMFGIGPYVCEFICDTASDITTLPTSISEGTGGRTAYDNQKCASGSIAIVASGTESKRYMLNNQDIWCPYSVSAGSSSGGSSESSITVDFALSETSENPVANKTITAALNNKADVSDLPDLSVYALKSKYGDTTINVGRKEGTYAGECSTAEGQNTTASNPCSHAEGSITVASGICSHAEGVDTVASGAYSHSEGDGTTASGVRSHAGGGDSVASGDSSFAHGKNAQALNDHEVAFGQYNISYPNLLFSVGDGTSESTRHNAFDITKTGGYLHNKHIATTDDIPDLTPYAKKTDVPGIKVNEAANADTVGGKSADDFAQIINLGANQTDTKTAVGTPTKTTIYCCINWTDYPAESPDAQGIVIAVNYNGSGIAGTDSMWVVQFFISARTGVVYKRYIGNTDVNNWEDCRDGGNADMVGGKDPGKIFYDNGMSSDLNNATKSGCYCAPPDTLNTPLSVWLLVDTINYNNQLIVQKAYTMGDTARTITYVRNYANNAWSNWTEISTTATSTT